ncbi:MAG: transposase [Acidobacteria bacterium]|nr:transposase [Acidobacteriota bacterium]
MARYGRLLTDGQSEKIRPLLPKPPRHRHGGRPRAADRKVLEGIQWILRSGARWLDPAGAVSTSLDLLAATAELENARRLAQRPACVPGRTR